MTVGLPALVLIVMLSVQYQVAEREMASVLFLSMIGSLITMSAFIALAER